MRHTPSSYFKSLCNSARLHFISSIALPTLGEYLPYPTVVEVVNVHMKNHFITYTARIWFDSRVTSYWYDVSFHPSIGASYRIHGAYRDLFLSTPSLAQVNVLGWCADDIPF